MSITGALLDRFPQAALTGAVATQAAGMLGRYATGTDPVAAVVFLVLMGVRCAPGRTDIALAANSGAYNAGIAGGAALGGLILPLADVRGTFLAGGLLTVGGCTVLLAGRLLRHGPESAE
ncbi:hypothetical protein [Streptomyces sp. B21-105]|uniref:hypothetical protein n=1 Tax=Streptomyces sp. B21-105 TaxID=3039417 RepID=UPI003FA6A949